MKLARLQDAFTAAVFHRRDEDIAAWIDPTGLEPAARLAIYRTNVMTNLENALAAVYPVVLRLVGEDFFRQAARGYIVQTPSASGDLHDFGEDFAAWLESMRETRTLPYLGDTARLEWLVHRSFHAADTPVLDVARLGTVAPERYPELHFTPAPAVRLLRSPWPIVAIWAANQPEHEEVQAVDLGSGGEVALLRRPDYEVFVEALPAGDAAALAACLHGLPFGAMLERALAADGAFDVGAFLRRRVADGTLADFHVDE